MTPIEAAVNAYILCLHDGTSAEADARAIITAFLDAAAGDGSLCIDVGASAMDGYDRGSLFGAAGRAAILKLKEAVNG